MAQDESESKHICVLSRVESTMVGAWCVDNSCSPTSFEDIEGKMRQPTCRIAAFAVRDPARAKKVFDKYQIAHILSGKLNLTRYLTSSA